MRCFVFVLVCTSLTACDKPTSPPVVDAPSRQASASAEPPDVGPEVPPPSGLNVSEFSRLNGCGGAAKSGPCSIVSKFAGCAEWNPVVPSGDGRWIGRGYVVAGAVIHEQFTMVRAHRVGMSEVLKGQLGVRLAVAELAKEDGAAYDQADRLIRTLERHDSPPRGSPTLELLRSRTSWSEVNAMRAQGSQVYALTTNGAYLCQGPKQSVLLVQRGASKSSSPDGLYAELWATDW